MKNLMKVILGAAGLMAPFAGHAHAQGSWALTGAADVQSDYRFRGISQNDRDPAPQGMLNLSGPDGFYVGAWASKIDWRMGGVDDNPSVELDLYGGKHFDLGGSDLNVEAYYYAYPDADTFGGPKASFFEGIFQLSHVIGPLTLTGTYAVSPEFSLGGGTGNAVAGTAAYTINDWLSVSGNIGHQWVAAAPSDYSYGDIGVTGMWRNFALDLRYSGTDLGSGDCAFYMGTRNACNGGFVATFSYNISLLP
jgi:uncharacterized protein (TIGR02001 family)